VPPEHAHGPTARPGPEFGLALAGTLTSGMALYHFWLPYAFHWSDVLTHVPMVRWGLFIINASFSLLLLAGGLMSIGIAFRPILKHDAGRWVILAMAGYWLFNAAYQVLIPMPMPNRLAGLKWAFLGYSLSVALLYLGALVERRPPAIAAVGRASPAPRRSPWGSR
jgi:hypothetical protein